ncbi:hypothetical protein RUND412_004827 [Rhizina undulata]
MEITEDVLKAAAGNIYHGKEVMEVLLAKCGDIKINEGILRAAAANTESGHEAMEILLANYVGYLRRFGDI